jgi:hypothetical protein
MGYQTARGLPIPFGSDGNNVPADLLAFASRLDVMFTPYLASAIDTLGGADLWDGRIIYQADVNATRPWTGLYVYKQSLGIWQALAPTATAAYQPLDVGGANPTLGTGAENIGRWCRFGPLILAVFAIYTGSAGYVNADWVLRCPVTPQNNNNVLTSPATQTSIGKAVLTDVSASATYLMNLTSTGYTDPTRLTGDMQGQTNAFAATGTPVALASGDTMAGVMFYEGVEQTV